MASSRPSTPQSVESAVRLASTQLGEKSPPPGAEKKPGSAIDKSTPPATAAKTWILLSSVFMAMFLVALDRTIISTAIPAITNDFDSLQDVGWYGSSYLLTCCAFQLLFGKLYAFFSVKAVFLWSILVFEVASVVCGAAPNSVAFIVGRAISGIGAAGIFAGTIVCIVHTIPLQHRPRIQGLFGALFGIASVIGPLIGGAFTTNVTWRWCFYINLPIGAVAAVVIFFWLQMPERDTAKQPLKQKLAQLDALGTFFLVPGVVCLLLALQWGGQTYSWSNWRIILLLCLAGVLLLAFGAVQVFFPKTATLPPHIFKQRSVCSAFWSTLCIGSGNYIFVYFLPIWFQSIQGASAVDSGIHLLPLMLSMVVGSLAGGFTTPKIGYYTPYAIIGSCIMAVGAGLITTFHVDTSEGMWIGYQVVYGLGLGLCFQVPNLAVQTVMPKPEVPIGLALMLFGQLLGAAVFIAVGENVLGNQLVARLAGIPGIDEGLVTTSGATSLLASVAENLRPVVLMAYNKALQKVFEVGLVISCLTVLGTATLEWRSISKKPEPKAGGESGAPVADESGAPVADGKSQKKGFEEAIKEQVEETRKS